MLCVCLYFWRFFPGMGWCCDDSFGSSGGFSYRIHYIVVPTVGTSISQWNSAAVLLRFMTTVVVLGTRETPPTPLSLPSNNIRTAWIKRFNWISRTNAFVHDHCAVFFIFLFISHSLATLCSRIEREKGEKSDLIFLIKKMKKILFISNQFVSVMSLPHTRKLKSS